MLTLICGRHEQAVLDKHGHQLLADFVHTTAYNTADPFARRVLPRSRANVGFLLFALLEPTMHQLYSWAMQGV